MIHYDTLLTRLLDCLYLEQKYTVLHVILLWNNVDAFRFLYNIQLGCSVVNGTDVIVIGSGVVVESSGVVVVCSGVVVVGS